MPSTATLTRRGADGSILVRSEAAFVLHADGLFLCRSHDAVLIRASGVFVRVPFGANFYDDVDSGSSAMSATISRTENAMDLDSKSKLEKRLEADSGSHARASAVSEHRTLLETATAHRKPLRGESSVEVRRG